MIYFYLVWAVLAATLLITDMVLLYMVKMKSFGLERKLFKFKVKTVPLEKFLPENLTVLFAALLCMGISGIIFDVTQLKWYMSLPVAITSGFVLCFFLQYFLKNTVDKHTDKTLPLGDAAANANGWVVEEIDGVNGDYGLIEFEYKELKFRAPAMSANETKIPEYEKVIVLFEENGFYFVQSIKEVYTGLKDDM
ncbi:MAG: hypothetical protein FWG44_05665 [Oscillospiraceae bacterium]|nr:hypothetical protein [Oscillospiraceae bacterium]